MKFKDLNGRQFGSLKVLSIAGTSKDSCRNWRCLCICGKECIVKSASLLSGNTKSCGCSYSRDWTGKRVGRLSVINLDPERSKSGQKRWVCLCDCGVTITVLASHLVDQTTQSCGCLNRERKIEASTTHGMSGSLEWNSYHAAKKRCNPKYADKYPDWAGRGIEFRFKGFEEFYTEVGPRPEPKSLYSLERIDNNGHYEKGNVRWATKKEQARNRRCAICDARNDVLKLSQGLGRIPLTNCAEV